MNCVSLGKNCHDMVQNINSLKYWQLKDILSINSEKNICHFRGIFEFEFDRSLLSLLAFIYFWLRYCYSSKYTLCAKMKFFLYKKSCKSLNSLTELKNNFIFMRSAFTWIIANQLQFSVYMSHSFEVTMKFWNNFINKMCRIGCIAWFVS